MKTAIEMANTSHYQTMCGDYAQTKNGFWAWSDSSQAWEEFQLNGLTQVAQYSNSQLGFALDCARKLSKVYPNTRIVVENYSDAHGCSVWANSNRSCDGKELILFLNGKRKKA